jgi:hypothetical protein
MREELRELDDIDVPDDRGRSEGRTRFDGVDVASPPRPWIRLGTAIIAIVVFAGSVLFAWNAFTPDSHAPAGEGAGVFMAVDPNTRDAVMAALLRAPLLIRNGCVLLGAGDGATLPIWPKGFTADLDASGRVVIHDDNGRTVAIEGQPVELGGGYIAEFAPASKVDPKEGQIAHVESMLGYELPDGCLSDTYGVWLVGQTTPVGDALSTPTSGGPDRVGVYAALIRFLVASPDTEGRIGSDIHVDPTLCSIDHSNCKDRLSDEEQTAIASQLGDLGTVRFIEGFSDGDPTKILLGPIDETADGTRVEGGSICGGLCGTGGTYIVEPTTSGDPGYVVTGIDRSYGTWIA